MSVQEEDRKLRVSKLVDVIKKYLVNSQSYHFRPVKIDGVYCYPIIHKSPRLVNFEATNIYCEKKNQCDENSIEKYSLYHTPYKTIEQAVKIVEQISAKYKIYGGDLCSPDVYEMLKLEEVVLPYNEDQKCCVCFENTTDTTVCDHYICLSCREICILKKKPDCPMCRKQNIMRIYKSENGLVNNHEYSELKQAYDIERSCGNMNFTREPSDDEMSIDEDEYDEDEDDEETIEISYVIDRVGDRSLNTIDPNHISSHAISEIFSIFDENNEVQSFNFDAIIESINNNE
jgi:hypothetical protein